MIEHACAPGSQHEVRRARGVLRGNTGVLRGNTGVLRGNTGVLRGNTGVLRGNTGAMWGNMGAMWGNTGAMWGNMGAMNRAPTTIADKKRPALPLGMSLPLRCLLMRLFSLLYSRMLPI
jgi:hypothetical protein